MILTTISPSEGCWRLMAIQNPSSQKRATFVAAQGPPAILGGFPFASNQPRSLQPLKGDKQRTRIEAENALAHLFEPDGDPISVHGFERQRFQNKHVQSALDEIPRLVRHRCLP